MNITTQMVRKLVASGDIRTNTEIEANYNTTDLSGLPILKSTGNFLVRTVKIINNICYLNCVSATDGSQKTILAENILSIDGMCISRFVTSSIVSTDTKQKTRGRPRKNKG